MQRLLLTLITLLCATTANLEAQNVITLAQSPYIQDGLHVDSQGKVYTTCGGLVQKNTLGMYDPETKEFKVISNDMRGSIDITGEGRRYLYVTNYDDNTVKRFDKQTGETIDFASDLDGPAGIVMDKNGNLYVTSFGAPPSYAGKTVWKIDPDGNKEKLVESDELIRPQGIVWFDEQNLLVANSSDGKLFLVDINTRELKLWTNSGNWHGNMAVGRGKIYIASNRGHKILELNRKGEITATFGDDNAVIKNGPLSEANFANPLGLAFSPDEKVLYVAQIMNGTLRAIVFED